MGQGISVVGSLNADLVVTVRRFPSLGETVTGHDFAVFSGGKGANQAYAAGRLAAGIDPARAMAVRMFGQVGNDTYGPWLRKNLADAGIDVTEVGIDPRAPTGLALVTIDAAGQNQIVVVPGANGTFNPGALTALHRALADSAVVLLQLEIPLPTVQTAARIGREGGAIVILDPAPARVIPDGLLRSVHYLTPNETELGVLTGSAPQAVLRRGEAVARARQLLARGVAKVIVKMGRQGVLLVTETSEQLVPAFPVEAVDTTAAGDAFNAGFGFALARGLPELEAIRFGAAAGAVSVTRPGAQPSMPTLDEVEALLGN
jgi:ribokinase